MIQILGNSGDGTGRHALALVKAYHCRSLQDHYRFLFFDSVVLNSKAAAKVPGPAKPASASLSISIP